MKDRAEFYAVYIKEAHPTDGWRTGDNVRLGIDIKQATNFEERLDAASQCCGALHMEIPMVVDGIDNRVGEAYSGFPDRLYVIDADGKVAYKSEASDSMVLDQLRPSTSVSLPQDAQGWQDTY